MYVKARLFDRGHTNAAYDYAVKTFREQLKDQIYIDPTEVTNADNKYKELLTQWKLSMYIIKMEEFGYDDINDWNVISNDEFTDMGFKPG